MTIEITEILKACFFDYIIIETVGVGQNEVDIVALADITTVVLVPESGDEIQTMKSGLIEIADIFVINKCDRPGADKIKMGLLSSMHTMPDEMKKPVIETTATNGKGIHLWMEEITRHMPSNFSDKKIRLLAEKAWQLIIKEKMKDIDKEELISSIKQSMHQVNLYSIVNKFIQ
jgi:LAO/AO transport system kinase